MQSQNDGKIRWKNLDPEGKKFIGASTASELSKMVCTVRIACNAEQGNITYPKLLNIFLIAPAVCRTLHFQKIEFKDQSRGVTQ
jgi:hypothetical protein